MAMGKKLYYAVTRGLLRYADREGGGPRLARDAPLITARLKTHPCVRETIVLAYPDRRSGTGLYAFVEAVPELEEVSLREFMAGIASKAPEHVQVVEELPRSASGEVRSEILQLIAMNQVDLIEGLSMSEQERSLVARIVAGRRNLRDRFSF
jgi:hypothetical protein